MWPRTSCAPTIVPALLAALEKEKANDIVTGCLIALAKIGDVASESGDSEYAQVIARFLKDPSQEIRETAAVALGILAHPSSLPLLDGLFNNTQIGHDALGSTTVDQRTRAFAGYGLGLMAKRNSNPELQQKILRLIAESLPAASREAAPDLAVSLITSMGLTTPPISGAEPTKEAPANAWDSAEGALDFLIGQWTDDKLNYLMRAHLPVAMGRILQSMVGAPTFEAYKAKVAASLLLPMEKRTQKGWPEELQQSAAFAMGLVGDCDADKLDVDIRKALTEQTLDAQRQTRRYAMIALAKVGARRGTVGAEEFAGLADISKHLTRRLSDGKGGDEHWAGLAIGVLGNYLNAASASVPADMGRALHEKFQKDSDNDASAAFAVSLGILGLKDAQDDLLKRMEKVGDWTAKGYLTLGLGLMGAAEAKAKIQELVKSSEFKPDLLKQAAIALGLLGDSNIVPELTEMLRNASSLSAQAAIASALGFIGDQRSIDPLVKMLKDESLTDGARGFAAVALGIVADKESLPWNSKVAVDVNYRASTQTLNTTDGKGILNIL
jgi:HEAT repeat protein